ncbi:hypothetical protein BJ742DRAFT_516 [Cladochytrium replicatum]|nr:hypothetical protein BJ742DRAFT_516 [Cladochytrium replicatum]
MNSKRPHTSANSDDDGQPKKLQRTEFGIENAPLNALAQFAHQQGLRTSSSSLQRETQLHLASNPSRVGSAGRITSPDNSQRSSISIYPSGSAFESQEAQKKIMALTRELADFKYSHEKKTIELEKRNAQLSIELQEVDSGRRLLYERNKTLSEQFLAEQKAKQDAMSSATKIGREKAALEEKIVESERRRERGETDRVAESQKFKQAISQLEVQLLNTRKDLHLLSEKNKALTAELDGASRKLQQSERSQSQHSTSAESPRTSQLINRQFEETLQRLQKYKQANESLQRDRDYYKNLYESNEKFKEENRALTLRVAKMNQLRDRIGELEALNARLSAEREAWKSFVDEEGETIGVGSPHEMFRLVARQRLEIARWKENAGGEAAGKVAASSRVAFLEDQVQKSEAKASMHQAEALSASRLLKSKDRESRLLQQQIDILQGQLRANDAEMVLSKDHYSNPNDVAIKELENLVSSYRSEIAAMQLEITQLTLKQQESHKDASPVDTNIDVSSTHLLQQLQDRQKELDNAKRESTLLEREIAALCRQVAFLEESLETARDSSSRILELRDNPEAAVFAIRKAKLDALMEENRILREQLQLLSDVGFATRRSISTTTESTVPLASFRALEVERDQLAKECESKDKYAARLKEGFNKYARGVGDVIQSFLGYSLRYEPGSPALILPRFGKPPTSLRLDPNAPPPRIPPFPSDVFLDNSLTIMIGTEGDTRGRIELNDNPQMQGLGCAAGRRTMKSVVEEIGVPFFEPFGLDGISALAAWVTLGLFENWIRVARTLP